MSKKILELLEARFPGAILETHSQFGDDTAVVDDAWCTVGTFNLDSRSSRFALEVNVAVEDPGVAAAMRDRFRRDTARARAVDLKTWRYRPLRERLLEHFFYLFRKLL